LLLRHLTFHKD